MKAISTLLLLVLFLNVSGQDSTGIPGTGTTIFSDPDAGIKFWKIIDTSYGSVILANCPGCMVQARPAIHIARTGEIKVRSWNRKWIFGKIQYHYSLPKKTWVLIDFIPCK